MCANKDLVVVQEVRETHKTDVQTMYFTYAEAQKLLHAIIEAEARYHPERLALGGDDD